MCDVFKFKKDCIEATINLNKSSICRSLSNIVEMYLIDKYCLNGDEQKALKDYFRDYRIYDKFDRVIKKCDDGAKVIKD